MQVATDAASVLLMVAALAGIGAPPVAGQAVGGQAVTSPARCEVARAALTLADGSEVFVEAEEFLALGDELLVVGSPTYTWRVRDGEPVQQTAVDRHIAARFDVTGRAELIEKPIPGTIGSVRAVALGERRWGMLFNEVHPDSLPSRHYLLDIWYAEHDGTRWDVVERVQPPEEGEVDFWSDSELVRASAGLEWIVAVRLPTGLSRLAHYQRRAGRWDHRIVSDDWVELSSLAYDSARGALWMAHFSEDPGIPDWQQSLRLYRYGDGWELATRATVVPSGIKVRDPRLIVLPDGIGVSWWLLGGAETDAWARVGIDAGPEAPAILLDPRAFLTAPLGLVGGQPAWILSHLTPEGRLDEVRVVRRSPTDPSRVDVVSTVANPYPSFFVAALVANQVVVVGPEMSRDPTKAPVRSLILRLNPSCT